MAKVQSFDDKIAEREARKKQSLVAKMLNDVPIEDEGGSNVQSAIVSKKDRESRSVKKQILLTPSLADKISDKCAAVGVSMNEAVNQLLEAWVNE